MTAGVRSDVSPKGNPVIARTCASYWLVVQASIVAWPELWGRGASSFTTSVPSFRTKNSTQRTPT